MNERLEEMRRRVRDREHKRFRQAAPPDISEECAAEGLSWMQRIARLACRMCEAEIPVIEPDERIVFTRTLPKLSAVFTPDEWEKIKGSRTVHAWDMINNICADWGMVLSQGLLGRKQAAIEAKERFKDDPESVEFLDCAIETIDAVLDLAKRYAAKALEVGREDLADILEHVPANPPRTFHEALQSLRFCHAALWLSSHYHVGLGRLDQYLLPYLQADIESGRLDEQSAEELLAEFFISLNKDADIYPGALQGDNGQTIVLGGVKRDGTDAVNELTWMALRAARDISMIDPKINLRISSKTDLDLLCLATELTRKGLGFPQYANDDVVIPALVAHGYELEDARDYSVAACWEFVIPGKGMEIVNIAVCSFPHAADAAIREGLAAGDDFNGIMKRTAEHINQQIENNLRPSYALKLPPGPFYSVLMDGCIENGRDLSKGLKYNNFGVHGACSASAADALAAVKKFVFEEKTIEPAELLKALEANYEGYEELRKKLAEEAPKVGNNDDAADEILVKLFDYFADACEAFGENGRGGIVRPGSGSAMFYVTLASRIGATAEGRKSGEYFSANLAPAPGTRIRGPISVFQSYSKIDYQRICNGGPITMELSDTVFRDEESIQKVAMLVRTFAQLGCQQLQLNSLNAQTLLDAKANPEKYKNLIVRVWGWSGYFCELDPPYQDHVIQRHLYATSN